jgi:hypothetical protein
MTQGGGVSVTVRRVRRGYLGRRDRDRRRWIVSRKPRSQFGLDIVCRDHPGEVLQFLRVALDGTIVAAGPQDRGVARPGENWHANQRDYKWTRRCGRPMANGTRCTIDAQFHRDKANTVLRALAASGATSVETISDLVMQRLEQEPSDKITAYFIARRLTDAG